jgi:hypothetical protein
LVDIDAQLSELPGQRIELGLVPSDERDGEAVAAEDFADGQTEAWSGTDNDDRGHVTS